MRKEDYSDVDVVGDIRLMHPETADVDVMLYPNSSTIGYITGLAWLKGARRQGIGKFVPYWHRIQVERFVWDNSGEMINKRVMDVGQVPYRRDWLGKGYFTFGDQGCDVTGDLQDIQMEDNSVDHIVCTEVLEHVPNPLLAVEEMHRILKPGGLLLASSPFLWPYHGTKGRPNELNEFYDFWRFTKDGWSLIMRPFADFVITSLEFTDESKMLLDLVRRFECWLFRSSMDNALVIGYVAKGRK